MKRFFALGCSYTYYSYPTWANWLGSSFDHFENLGLTGLGNRAIFNKLSELIYKRNLTPDDTVVIAWSSPTREDRWYRDSGWTQLGNIYNQTFYPHSWVQKYFDPFMGLMETLNYIHASLHILDNIGCKYIMTWMMRPDNIDASIEQNGAKSQIELCDPDNKLGPYLKYLLTHENLLETDIYTFDKNFQKQHNLPNILQSHCGIDLHPKPLSTYHYVKEILCPKLNINNFDTSGELLQLANDWTVYLSDLPRKVDEPKWPKHGPAGFDAF